MPAGVHVEERNEKYSGEMTKLLNSQSQAYVTRKRQQELKTVDRLKSTLHMIGAGKAKNKHTLFLDSKEQGMVLRLPASVVRCVRGNVQMGGWMVLCKKPNSAQRKIARVRLSNGRKITCYE
jgi:ribosomal protein S12